MDNFQYAHKHSDTSDGRLSRLQFDNSFARLPSEFYSRVRPQPLRDSHVVSINGAAAQLLGINPQELDRGEVAAHFGDMVPLPGEEPLAMVYAGHQFGVYVPQLGDGRALLLGEVAGKDGQSWDLQLKGAGKTPYSRMGDGRAVLRSTVREYLGGEALHALGVPTTRALCVVGSDEPVWREARETGATLLRIAHSHIRFGHFEYFHYHDNEQALRQLADYVIGRHYPEWSQEADRYFLLFRSAVTGTARLMAHWQAWGFAHGVMNTDNMSILGDTLDFGPYGFMDRYNPGWICNHSDHHGRYAWDRQPSIGLWNCAALAQPFSRLVPEARLREVLEQYEAILTATWTSLMRRRLGLAQAEEEDTQLFGRLLMVLHRHNCDYAISLRELAPIGDHPRGCPLGKRLEKDQDWEDWAGDFSARLQRDGTTADVHHSRVHQANPCYLLRNHLMHTAIDHAVRHRDYREIDRLLQLVQSPFEPREEFAEYAGPAPDWSEMLEISCSS